MNVKKCLLCRNRFKRDTTDSNWFVCTNCGFVYHISWDIETFIGQVEATKEWREKPLNNII